MHFNIDKYIYCYECAATLLVFLVLFLRLYINKKVESIDRKKMFLSVPSEISILVLGFNLSDAITYGVNNISNNTSNNISNNISNNKYIINIIILLLVLVFQFSSERQLENKLNGNLKDWGMSVIIKIIVMYLFSIVMYINGVWG